jgi:c-di-GMP-binding flagellar brake protein YcgR
METQDMLRDGIARNVGVVFSLPSAGMLRHHKSRLLADCAEGFWVESIPQENALIDELIGSGERVGISFKAGHDKIVFATPILRRDDGYRVNANLTMPAALLKFPEQIRAIQRRSNYRVALWPDCEISARIWRLPEKVRLVDRPLASAELKVQMRDISVGGLGVLVTGKDGERPKLCLEDRLRIELNSRNLAMLVEGRLRYPHNTGRVDVIRAGIQFTGLDQDLQGRQIQAQITKLIGELQREELRRCRMGLAA